MPNPIEELIEGFQGLVEQVPELLQPVIIAGAAAIPFIEGEVAAAIGVIGGVPPIVAGVAAILGNLTCVVLVVLLSSGIRDAALARRLAKVSAPAMSMAHGRLALPSATLGAGTSARAETSPTPESKGRQKARRWLVRFGLPGASLLGPLAIPTPFTAAMFAASGFGKRRVILWQAIAIILWTGVATISATIAGFLAASGS